MYIYINKGWQKYIQRNNVNWVQVLDYRAYEIKENKDTLILTGN